MGTRERARDRGLRHARRIHSELAEELRTARLIAGLSQAEVARVVGTDQSTISRAETGRHDSAGLERLSVHLAALGMRLHVRAYPDGAAVRDAGQLAVLRRFQARVGDGYAWQSEALIGGHGDLRAWDVLLSGKVRIGVDAETRIHDV